MRRQVSILDPQMMTTFLWIFVVVTSILIGAALIQRVRAAYYCDLQPEDILESLRQALADGELDQAEFRRVEESLAKPPASLADRILSREPVKNCDAGESLRELD